MVKYLSDNKSDPRFQTILSKPQPFQATVAEERYPVDEVDLSKSLGVIQNIGNAYFRQQGEEQERERMGLSFEIYQANRAEQQTRQAAAEKEKGLKNTMLNDYAIAVSRLVLDPYMQDGPDKLSPVAAERKLRDLREQYIKMTGGVLNASDLMKIEKDSGVTFTKDLYNADLQRQNESYKKQIEDLDKAADATWEEVHGAGSSAGIDQRTKNQFYADTLMATSALDGYVQNDVAVSSATPAQANGTSIVMSSGTNQNLGDLVRLSFEAIKDNALSDSDPEYLNANQMLDIKRGVTEFFKSRRQVVNGQETTLAALYGDKVIEGVVNLQWKLSGIEAPYTDEQKRRKEFKDYMTDKKDIIQSHNAILKANTERKEILAKSNLQDVLSPQGLYLLEQANIINNLMTIDSAKADALTNIIRGSVSLKNAQGLLGPISEGRTMKDIADKAFVADKEVGMQVKDANIESARVALSGKPQAGLVPYSMWDIPSAYEAINDRQNTLLNGEEDPTSNVAEVKEKNTTLHRNLYIKARSDKNTWDNLSEAERDSMTRDYTTDTNVIAKRNLGVLREEGLAENIAFDKTTNRFVPVNLNESAGSQKQTRLFSVIDTLNNLSHSGFEELDKGLVDNLLARDYGGTPVIRELTKEDKIVPTSSTVEFAKALYGGDYKRALGRVPGTWMEGLSNALESVTQGALWLAEKGSQGAVTTAIFGEKQGEKLGEAVADVVDFITNPERSAEKEKNEVIDAFADVVLKGEDMTKEEKQQAKEEFREQVKAVKDFLTPKGELFGDTTTRWEMPGKDLLSGLQNILEDSSVKWEMPGKKLFSTLKNFLLGSNDLETIPPYNMGIITRIVQEDETVTPEEAKAALMAIEKASPGDRNLLDSKFNTGIFEKNVAQKVKEASENKKKRK